LVGFNILYAAPNTVAAPSANQLPTKEKWKSKIKAAGCKSIVRGGGFFVLREE
jgi:hypothetical protein